MEIRDDWPRRVGRGKDVNESENAMAISADDMNRFIQGTKSTNGCPFCGNPHFEIIGEMPDSYPAIPILQNQGIALPPPHIPVIVAVCSNCYFVRQHTLRHIEEWLKGHPVQKANNEQAK